LSTIENLIQETTSGTIEGRFIRVGIKFKRGGGKEEKLMVQKEVGGTTQTLVVSCMTGVRKQTNSALWQRQAREGTRRGGEESRKISHEKLGHGGGLAKPKA